MAKRIEWLDIVKGLAILGVVLQHTFQRLDTYYNLGGEGVWDYLNWLIISCNMEVFFVVSGVIYFLQRERYQDSPKWFVKTRFIDLIIPYLILGPTIWLGKFLLSSFVRDPVSVNDLYRMFVTPIAFMWFIYILFFVEILAFLIDKLSKGAYLPVLMVLFVISYTTRFYPFGVVIDIYHRVPYYLFWYYLGGVLVLYKEQLSAYLGKRLLTVSLGILWVASYTYGYMEDLGYFSIIKNLLGVAFWVSLFKDQDVKNVFNKAFHYLGKRTMYIYILNPLIINGTWQILKKLELGGYFVPPCSASSSLH